MNLSLKRVLIGLTSLLILSCTGLSNMQNKTIAAGYEQGDADYETAQQMISAGQVDAGIAKLKKLSDAQPENAQYRSMLKIQQQLQIASMLKAAEATNIKNDPEAAYKQVLALDPNNQRALEGLKKLSLTQNHVMMLAKRRGIY